MREEALDTLLALRGTPCRTPGEMIDRQELTVQEHWEEIPVLTELITENVGGASWAILQFTLNDVFEAGILIRNRSYAFPGGEKLRAWYDVWSDPNYYKYDGSMEWPNSISLDDEDSAYLVSVGADIQTFIRENYLQFVDGSKPMSEWDDYVNTLQSLTGWEESKAIYQKYYDDFMATYA